jgi:hypothetical protein
MASVRHNRRADLVESLDHLGSGLASDEFCGRLIRRNQQCKIILKVIRIDAIDQHLAVHIAAFQEHVINRTPINGKNDDLSIRNRRPNGL